MLDVRLIDGLGVIRRAHTFPARIPSREVEVIPVTGYDPGGLDGYLHYSLSTEKLHLYWIRFLARWFGWGGSMRHPREMVVPKVESLLFMLAT